MSLLIHEVAYILLRRLKSDRWIYAFILGYGLFALLLASATGQRDKLSYAIYLPTWLWCFTIVMPIALFGLQFCYVVHRFDYRRRLAFRRIFAPRQWANLFAGILLVNLMVVFQASFTGIKNLLLVFDGGFQGDLFYAEIDRKLHFGIDPWRILYAYGQSAVVRSVVELNYNAVWFLICFGTLFYVATCLREASKRSRYMLEFMIVWVVLGNVLAGLSLSAGPAFYGFITGDFARFADQIAFLAQSRGAHSASLYQAYLWQLQSLGTTGMGGGIAAFPSVHVGLITMNALYLLEHSRKWGAVAVVYMLFVLASSVYLAWHYAIDGYAAIVVVMLIHGLMKWLFSLSGTAEPGAALQAVAT